MNSWVIAVLLIWTFNAKGKEIAMPLQALSHFFEVFNQFDWAQYAWTVSGPVSLEQLTASSQQSQTFLSESFSYLPPSLFDFSISDDPRFAKSGTKNRDQRDREKEPAEFLVTPTASTEDIFGEESNPSPVPPSAHSPVPTIDRHYDGKEVYRKGILNIIDPFDSKKNLLEGLEATGCELLVSALRDAYQSFQAVCEESSKLLGFGQFSTQKIIDEVERLMKTFFLNTSQKYLSNADTLPEEVVEGSEESRFDSWAINREDLQFSLSYGRMALGGKIDLQLLTQLVLIILEKKGTMPVGEIGKNLQSLMGCESLSKRLKEQFSGLKRAIENSNSARIKMGNEHPFNPTVSLLPPPSNESQSSRSSSQHYSISASFHHADYLFVPYNYQVQMQAAAVKELHQAQQQGLSGPRQNRHYYRRPAPVILETHSLISQSSSLSSSNGEMSPDLHHYRRSNQPSYRPKGGSGAYLSSPSGNRSYFRGNPNQMPHQGSVFPLGVDVNGIPIPPPSTYGFPSVPIYPPPIYGHPPPPFYPPQMHNSLSSSVSSSYGQTSPMSQSPMNPSYLLHANFDYPPPHNTSLPSHPGGGSPNPRINNNNN